jgi:hypothetical protein
MPMPCRVLIRALPAVVVAGLVTGCSPAESASAPAEAQTAGIASSGQDAQARRAALPDAMAPTPQAATELFDAVDADLDAEIKRRAPAEKASKERLQRERLRQSHGDSWAPSGGGWGG